ncbi:MAG: PspC domain-containing protein [Anaerolineae bacterium]|nr:PspC domain-containing protein [Anaerolineae bacterium]
MAANRKLYRSRHDRQIAGVCGGLAEYFNLDPTLIRLIFVLITFLGGPGLVLYIIMAIVVPEESDEKPKNVHNVIVEDSEPGEE